MSNKLPGEADAGRSRKGSLNPPRGRRQPGMGSGEGPSAGRDFLLCPGNPGKHRPFGGLPETPGHVCSHPAPLKRLSRSCRGPWLSALRRDPRGLHVARATLAPRLQ